MKRGGPAVLLIWASTLSLAENPRVDAGLQQYQQLATRALTGDILPRLIAVVPKNQREIIGTTPVVVVLERDPYRSGFTHRPKDPPRFELSTGLIAALDIASDATALAARTGENRKLLRYATDYSAALRSQWSDAARERKSPKMFAEHIGLDRKRYEALRTEMQFQELRIAMMTQSLAWISAHQMAHWLLEREELKSTEELAKHERDVDRLASDLAYRAGYSAAPPLVNTVLFASADHPERDRTEAQWVCRATEITGRGMEYAQRDSEAVIRYGSQKAASKYFDRQQRELVKLRKEFKCPKVTVSAPTGAA